MDFKPDPNVMMDGRVTWKSPGQVTVHVCEWEGNELLGVRG